MQAKGITGILNGVEDIVKPDNDELGLEVLFDSTSLEKKSLTKTKMQAAQVTMRFYICIAHQNCCSCNS